jgi:hypothetical protein
MESVGSKSSMSSLEVDAKFFRGVLVLLVFATAVSCAGVVLAVLTAPSPPAAVSVSRP